MHTTAKKKKTLKHTDKDRIRYLLMQGIFFFLISKYPFLGHLDSVCLKEENLNIFLFGFTNLVNFYHVP